MATHPYVQINLKALTHNLSKVRDFAPSSKIFAVVKANAYGHGLVETATALSDTDAYAVARIEEGIQLRKAQINKPIILLEGVRSSHELQLAAEHQLSPVFHHQQQIDWLDQNELTQPLQFCWLMVETGMHRLGFPAREVKPLLSRLNESSSIEGEIGLMAHFANSDSIGDARNLKQHQSLLEVSDAFSVVSMANSGAIMTMPEAHHDWVRPGIMLYGSSPFADKTAAQLGLKPAMQFKSVITAIQKLSAGNQVGYGGDYIVEKDMTIATVSVGYGDGYHRALAKRAYVDINGQLAKVVGRVSMDMICIDITEHDGIELGQEVTLWGSDLLPVDKVAEWANTISYELLCHVTERVPRVWQK